MDAYPRCVYGIWTPIPGASMEFGRLSPVRLWNANQARSLRGVGFCFTELDMEYFKAQRRRKQNWMTCDHPLDRGELGFESDTGRCKIGDGVKAWTLLPYLDEMGAGGGGILLVTKVERMAMFALQGTVVYDTDLDCLVTFDGDQWKLV